MEDIEEMSSSVHDTVVPRHNLVAERQAREDAETALREFEAENDWAAWVSAAERMAAEYLADCDRYREALKRISDPACMVKHDHPEGGARIDVEEPARIARAALYPDQGATDER